MRYLIASVFCLMSATNFSFGASKISTFTLENGMEAVVIEDRRAPVVVHMLWRIS
jgi:zinc protease